MKARPGRLVLLGYPLSSSLSPIFQNAALRSARIPLTYETLPVEPAALAGTIASLVAEGAAGNVTIPHKLAVYELAAVRTPVADRAGAVNTFWAEDGVLAGDNTDVAGFAALVQNVKGSVAQNARVAVLGAGGAAAAVLTAIEQWRGARVRVWSRSEARRSALVKRFADIAEAAVGAQDAVRDATMVVNATSVGMLDDAHPIAINLLPRRATVIDVVYRRGGTSWVNAAQSAGHIAADGKEMLLAQGAASFERWFGIRPDIRAMREALG